MEVGSRTIARHLFGDGAVEIADLRAALDRRLVAALASTQRAAQGDADRWRARLDCRTNEATIVRGINSNFVEDDLSSFLSPCRSLLR